MGLSTRKKSLQRTMFLAAMQTSKVELSFRRTGRGGALPPSPLGSLEQTLLPLSCEGSCSDLNPRESPEPYCPPTGSASPAPPLAGRPGTNRRDQAEGEMLSPWP